jgi:hypothetical protein
MTPRVKHLLGGIGLAAVALCALPMVADSFGATRPTPRYDVNRAIKSDRLLVPNMTVAKRRVPTETVRQTPNQPAEEAAKPKLLDGCEPAFSSVTVPSMAHISGRCVG